MSTLKPLTDPDVRVAVVAELSRLSSASERRGNRCVKRGDYKLAVPNFQSSAQQARAAQALADGIDFDPRDRHHVEAAVANVRVRMAPSRDVTKGGGR